MAPDDNFLIFLKLGGSLITDKNNPSTALLPRIQQLANEIAQVLADQPGLRLILGHGSGSFGHMAASRFGTRQGVATPEEWRGFAEVWYQASALNRILVNALNQAGLPAVVFSAASSAVVDEGAIIKWDLFTMHQALEHSLLPVVHGDVAFDQTRGGTILSTEDLFQYLALELRPTRILLAGIEPGVYQNFPDRSQIIPEITPANQEGVFASLRGSAATDVTGGMESKVRQMLALTSEIPGLEVEIFSAKEAGDLVRAFNRTHPGTRIHTPAAA
jgi:isopentenyl phosphate kinase